MFVEDYSMPLFIILPFLLSVQSCIACKRANLLGWGSHEEQTPVSLALGVVYLGTSSFGFSA
jgi:hypothetical protein